MSTTEAAKGAAISQYTLVTHANANANKESVKGTLDSCYGVVVGGGEGEPYRVMRVGNHLGTGVQDWPVADTFPVEQPPTLKTDHGEFPLGQRVEFDGEYAGLRGTLVGMTTDGYGVFLCASEQDGEFDIPSHWMDPALMDKGEMFSPASCGYKPIPEKVLVGNDKDGNPVYVGDRIKVDPNSTKTRKGHTGTVLTPVGYADEFKIEWDEVLAGYNNPGTYGKGYLGYCSKLDGPEVLGKDVDGNPVHEGDLLEYVDADYPSWVGMTFKAIKLNDDADNVEVVMPSPDLDLVMGDAASLVYSKLRLIERKPLDATTKDGKPVHVGDVLEWVGGHAKEWVGVRVQAISPTDQYKKFRLITLPTAGYSYKVGDKVNLSYGDTRHVEPEPEPEPEAPDPDLVIDGLTYEVSGGPVCVGDTIIRTKDDGSFPTGTRAVVQAQSSPLSHNAINVKLVENASPGVWSAGTYEKVGAPTGYSYSDKQPILFGDDVVIDPGFPSAGTPGVVVGKSDQYVVIKFKSEKGLWTPGNFSRLQDEDKEKVADEAPKPSPALKKLQTALAELAELKDEVTDAIGSINDELTSAEQRDVEVEIDTEDLGYSVSVSTSNSELLAMISYDGCGELTIDDEAVDEHARNVASVSWDDATILREVSLGNHLGDLHSALATGQEKVEALLEALADIEDVVTEALTDAAVAEKIESTVIPPKEVQTFEGVIHNARIGVVLPEDAETGPALRFDVVADDPEKEAKDPHTHATRRVRLTGAQIGNFLVKVAVSDVKNLEGHTAKLQEDAFGGWWPVAISEVPKV